MIARCEYAEHEWIPRPGSKNEFVCANCDKYRIDPEAPKEQAGIPDADRQRYLKGLREFTERDK